MRGRKDEPGRVDPRGRLRTSAPRSNRRRRLQSWRPAPSRALWGLPSLGDTRCASARRRTTRASRGVGLAPCLGTGHGRGRVSSVPEPRWQLSALAGAGNDDDDRGLPVPGLPPVHHPNSSATRWPNVARRLGKPRLSPDRVGAAAISLQTAVRRGTTRLQAGCDCGDRGRAAPERRRRGECAGKPGAGATYPVRHSKSPRAGCRCRRVLT